MRRMKRVGYSMAEENERRRRYTEWRAGSCFGGREDRMGYWVTWIWPRFLLLLSLFVVVREIGLSSNDAH